MKKMLEDLLRHKWWADATMFNAVLRCAPATQSDDVRRTFNHMGFSNRFWVWLTLGKPFDRDGETSLPESLDGVIARFRETQAEEERWLAQAHDAELARILEWPAMPGLKVPVSDAMPQVVLHSQGHRAQCASKLRALGGTPPTVDYVLWIKDRPAPVWPE